MSEHERDHRLTFWARLLATPEDTIMATEMTATNQQSAPETIFDLVRGFMISKHLFVANEIGLFTVSAIFGLGFSGIIPA